jgi:hypothetical protein
VVPLAQSNYYKVKCDNSEIPFRPSGWGREALPLAVNTLLLRADYLYYLLDMYIILIIITTIIIIDRLCC